MFDIGLTELLIIGVIALFVIGPERMPEAVRSTAHWLGRLRRSFNDIKRELQQELHNDAVLRDLRDSGRALREESDNLRQQLRTPLDELAGSEKAAAPTDDAAENPSTAPGASAVPPSAPEPTQSKGSEHRD